MSRSPTLCGLVAALCISCVPAVAQLQSLTTTFAGGNACSGNFFDVSAANDVTVCSFDVNLNTNATVTVQVWAVTGGGSYVPVAGSSSAWTLLGQATVTSNGLNTATPLDLALDYDVSAGVTQGFLVTCTSGVAMNYSNGTAVGTVLATDSNLTIFEGIYTCAPGLFNPNTSPRQWNGTIHYVPGLGQPCGSQPLEWQVNSPGASLTVNGAADPGPTGPITTVSAPGSSDYLQFSSVYVGLPWDVLFTTPEPGVPLSSGGFLIPSGDTLNIDLLAPSFGTLFGLAATNAFGGSFTLPLMGLPVGTQLSIQSLHVDPTQVNGVRLSHLNRYEVQGCSYQEDFESLAPSGGGVNDGGPYPNGWSNGPGTAQWQVYTGTTPSALTGPLAGAFSGANYMYCEASSPNFNTVFAMDTCLYDATALVNDLLRFRLSRIGQDTGTLNVLMDDGSGAFATLLMSYSGPAPGGTDWTDEMLPITPPASGVVAFRFEYTSGNSHRGDLAIDLFDLD